MYLVSIMCRTSDNEKRKYGCQMKIQSQVFFNAYIQNVTVKDFILETKWFIIMYNNGKISMIVRRQHWHQQ